MRKRGWLGLLLSVWLSSLTAYAQAGDSTRVAAETRSSKPPRRVRVLPVPAFGYEPETRFYLGAVALVTWHPTPGDTTTRPANAKVEVNITQNRQLILTSDWTAFTPHERYLTQGTVSYLRFPEDYWGVGNHTPNTSREHYDSRRLEVRIAVLRRLRPFLYAGPRTVVQNIWNVAPAVGGLLDRRTVPGARGGWSVGAGAGAVYDSRRNLLTPGSGAYAALAVTVFSPALGSEFRFTRYDLDMRRYQPVHQLVLAGQLTATVHTGEPSFRMLALLGSDAAMRGYYRGRYRDRQLVTGQLEVRAPLYWRLGAVAFAGAGQVARGLHDLGFGQLKPTVGGGLRLLVDRQENINLRLDYAVGRGSTGFYISFGEAF